jgi:heat shock protein HslJ
MVLPPGAVLTVTLSDLNSAAMGIISMTRLDDPHNPTHIDLPYHPSSIMDDHTYTIRATIEAKNRVLFTTMTPYNVITQGNPDSAEVLLQFVSPSQRGEPSIENELWRAVEINGAEIVPGEGAPNFELQSTDHRVSGSPGCNRMTGSYTLEGGSLRFSALATTRMACPEMMMQTEAHFLLAIYAVRAWQLNGTHLELLDEQHGVVMRLVAESSAGSP